MIGGTVFCASYYYHMYMYGEPDICLDGTYYQPSRLEEGTLSTLQNNQSGEMSGNTTSVDLKSG
jgi:hypothetical protein